MRDLGRLLRPRHVAVLGGWWAENVVRGLQAAGFAGAIRPVHPTRAEIGGVPCVRDLDALPEAPDAVFLGVNRDATIGVVARLAAMGAGGVIAFASGWSEVADGAERQAALVAAAGGMPLLGPNCYGFVNAFDGTAIWPDVHGCTPVGRGVAIIAQSSNVALNLTMQRRGLPVGYLMTAGNQAQTGVAQMVEAVLDDPRVTAIGLYLESFGDARALEAALKRAHAQDVPVVAIKAGASAASQALTLTHTASLAGPDNLADAFLARCGAVRVRSPEALVQALLLAHVLGPSPSATLGSMSCSGGEASLVADLAAPLGLDLAPLPETVAEGVRATVNPLVTVGNPFDYHTFDWGRADRLQATYAAFLRAGFGLAVLVLDWPREGSGDASSWGPAVAALTAAQAATGARVAVLASLPESLPEPLARRLITAGIAPLHGFAAGLEAAAAMARAGALRPSALPLAPDAEGTPHPPMTEAEAKAHLAAHGLAVPEGRVFPDADADADAAVTAAEALGFPVALKTARIDIAHKTEAGGVALALRDAPALRAAAAAMPPGPLLVERMVSGGVAELILGGGRDPQLGAFLTIGTGGVLVELMADSVSVLLPAPRDELRAALHRLRGLPLLTGFRGRPPGDLDAVLDAAEAVARAILANPALVEVEVNPLIVTPTGAVAADALLRFREAP